MIAVIDYDAGNIKSVEKALIHLGEDVSVTRDLKTIREADAAILPGVGAFGDAMKRLCSYGLVPVIREYVEEQKKPFLGICLGLQLLFSGSEESGGVEGLSLLEGEIRKIPDTAGLRVPHIGWNSLTFPKSGRLFEKTEKPPFVYFVHSYYLKAADPSIVAAQTEYGVTIDASVEKDNLFACQFHPEKSSQYGLSILERFVRYAHAYEADHSMS